MDTMKLAIISPSLPPETFGVPLFIYRLFKGLDSNKYILISPTNYGSSNNINYYDNSFKLKGNYYLLNYFIHPKFVRSILSIMNYYNIKWINNIYFKFRINRLEKILKTENCTHVIVCSGDLFDPYCAYVASKNLNVPYFLYAFDDYTQQWINKKERYYAQEAGPSIIRNAKGVFVPNYHLKKYYENEFGVSPKIIHNPIDLSSYIIDNSLDILYSNDSQINIVFTGSIYAAQLDSLRRLITAVSNMNKKNIHIHIYSHQNNNLTDFQNKFIIFHEILPNSQISDIQMKAHILFLPLAFSSNYSHSLINTSSPGKMGEYLASGRPILVHAPKGSFISCYFKKYECGYVVDSDDDDALKKAIECIIYNEDFREKICENARNRGEIDFDLKRIKMDFFSNFDE